MFGLYVLHAPSNQPWRNSCVERIGKVFGRKPVSIQGYKPTDSRFDYEDLPISPNAHDAIPGHIACVNGHRSILKHFLNETDYPFSFIFEDDTTFHCWVRGEHFHEAGRRVSALDPQWDWMLVCNPYTWPNAAPQWMDGTPRLDNIFRADNVSWGSHSFAVSRKGAKLLLERTTPYAQAFDVYTQDCSNARVYHGPELGCIPTGEDCPSTIMV